MILKDFLDLYRKNHSKVFCRTGALEVWKNSPENTCDEVILVKSQAAGLQLFKKRLRCRYYFPMNIYNNESSLSEVFCKKGVFRNFAKFTVFLSILQNFSGHYFLQNTSVGYVCNNSRQIFTEHPEE